MKSNDGRKCSVVTFFVVTIDKLRGKKLTFENEVIAESEQSVFLIFQIIIIFVLLKVKCLQPSIVL